MSDAATDSADRLLATNAAEPTRTSLWERLKPVWWLRGVLGAWSLVALIDQLGLVREDWLRVVHALASRWSQWFEVLTGWANVRLPWGLHISVEEATLLSLLSVLGFPIVASVARRNWNSKLYIAASSLVLAAAGAVAVLFAPESFNAPTGFGMALSPSAALIVLYVAIFWSITEVGFRWVPLLLMMASVTLFLALAFFGGSETASLQTWIVFLAPPFAALVTLWDLNRAYVKALLVALSFVLMLEVLYWMPAVNELIRPLVQWIDPQPELLRP